MLSRVKLQDFVHNLFDQHSIAEKATVIVQAILQARSPRLSDLSQHLPGNSDANYKMLQRFLDKVDPREALQRLFDPAAAFVLGDVTEIERAQARATSYVGTLKDGKTRGFWLLLLATPFRGRALPFGFVTYSSRTLQDQARSRNQEHRRCLRRVKELIADKILVLDREFSYESLMAALVEEGIRFVIRLNLGSRQPTLIDADSGRRVKLHVGRGKEAAYRGLLYKGTVPVQVAGLWRKGLKEPLWVITNLEPKEALSIYAERMKIEECFKDLKSLLGMDKIMNKRQDRMEKMLAMVMVAYSIGLMIGEALRDRLYGSSHQTPDAAHKPSSKWSAYSGLFVLLRHKISLTYHEFNRLVRDVLLAFNQLVTGSVRT